MMRDRTQRVLVIDDEEGIRNLLVRTLSRLGHEVDAAESGERGLEVLRQGSYDLLLLDMMMPKLSGIEILAQLQTDGRLRSIPVLVISALDEVSLVARCIEMGAADYLVKPFDPVVLKARVTACLERKRLLDQEHAYLEAMERELEIGRQIQSDFLPTTLPSVPGWDLAASFRPARQVAGDFYDAFPIGPDRLAIAIADVCDKGVGAALFMALTRTLVRVFAQERAGGAPKGRDATRGAIPADIAWTLESVRLTNDYLMTHHCNAGMFASLFFAVVDTRAGVVAYVNAGHDAPLHVGPRGSVTALAATDPAVGLIRNVAYEIRTTRLEPEDVLVAFTDGLTEARNARGEFFAESRLRDLVRQWDRGPRTTAADLIECLQTAVGGFTSGAEASDDITMLCLRRVGGAAQSDLGRSSELDASSDQPASR